MEISALEKNGVVVLSLSGKIMGGPDGTLLNDKMHELLDKNQKYVVVNLKEVNWMNSSGLGMLIGALTTMRANNGDLKLACITKKIESLMVITKLNKFFTTFETVEDALESFKL
ncbi:STAS domain-containing protein [bacterium]|nr:STAS domain-containing protein [bacterium]